MLFIHWNINKSRIFVRMKQKEKTQKAINIIGFYFKENKPCCGLWPSGFTY